MIPKVAEKRGSKVGGLLRYLYGPGKREEHVNPHLVAAWDGAGPLSRLEPPVGVDGKLDFRRLVDLLEQPVRAGKNPPHLPVWHCSVRNDPNDRTLTDQQWAHIAREMVAGIGLAPHGDDQAVRWVAVRHADEHIHIVATLVRQDRRTEWLHNEWRLSQATARDLEERYGLRRLGPADRTAHRRPHSAEVSKARRTGRAEPARDRLRRHVRYAAAAAGDEKEFFDLLHQAGVRVTLRHSSTNPRQVTGYTVALDEHTTADGQPIRYGGGRLAPDLSLPQLRRRWQTPAGAPVPSGSQAQVYAQAAATVQSAAESIRRLSASDPAAASAAGHAAADTLTVTARLVEGDRRGPLHRAAEALDRAAREPWRRALPGTRRAAELRAMSRLMHLAGQMSGDQKAMFAILRLILDLRLLADALAELRDIQQRMHQARAAREAARLLREAAGAAAHAAGLGGAIAPAPPGPVAAPTWRNQRRPDAPAAGRGR